MNPQTVSHNPAYWHSAGKESTRCDAKTFWYRLCYVGSSVLDAAFAYPDLLFFFGGIDIAGSQ
jgi:hypothetical protein